MVDGVPSGLSETDQGNIAAFLLGGQTVDTGRDNGVRNYTDFSPALLRRLCEQFAGDPCGSQIVSGLLTVRGLTPPAVANSCVITVEAQAVRVTTDGTQPSASVGAILPVGTVARISGTASMVGALFAGQASGAIVQVAYYT